MAPAASGPRVGTKGALLLFLLGASGQRRAAPRPPRLLVRGGGRRRRRRVGDARRAPPAPRPAAAAPAGGAPGRARPAAPAAPRGGARPGLPDPGRLGGPVGRPRPQRRAPLAGGRGQQPGRAPLRDQRLPAAGGPRALGRGAGGPERVPPHAGGGALVHRHPAEPPGGVRRQQHREPGQAPGGEAADAGAGPHHHGDSGAVGLLADAAPAGPAGPGRDAGLRLLGPGGGLLGGVAPPAQRGRARGAGLRRGGPAGGGGPGRGPALPAARQRRRQRLAAPAERPPGPGGHLHLHRLPAAPARPAGHGAAGRGAPQGHLPPGPADPGPPRPGGAGLRGLRPLPAGRLRHLDQAGPPRPPGRHRGDLGDGAPAGPRRHLQLHQLRPPAARPARGPRRRLQLPRGPRRAGRGGAAAGRPAARGRPVGALPGGRRGPLPPGLPALRGPAAALPARPRGDRQDAETGVSWACRSCRVSRTPPDGGKRLPPPGPSAAPQRPLSPPHVWCFQGGPSPLFGGNLPLCVSCCKCPVVSWGGSRKALPPRTVCLLLPRPPLGSVAEPLSRVQSAGQLSGPPGRFSGFTSALHLSGHGLRGPRRPRCRNAGSAPTESCRHAVGREADPQNPAFHRVALCT